jgi:hypothetical protein
MRTKALLLAAAVFAVGAGTSMAQVYSANAVGYVNLTLQAGFNLISNPLDNTNNGIDNLLAAALPANSRVYRFDPTQAQPYTVATRLNLNPPRFNTNIVFEPGAGFFVFVNGANPVNVTFVGEVQQGNLVNPLLTGNFQIKGSQVPQALPIGRPNPTNALGTLNYPAQTNDVVYLFQNTGVPATTGYRTAQFRRIGPNFLWTGQNIDQTTAGGDGPIIPVAAGFFLFRSTTATSGDWTRTFSVN